MSQWYYADRNRNRQGPVDAAVLAQLFREGRLDLSTLVWRDGMANWQALGDFVAELGLLDEAPTSTPAAEEPGALSLEPMQSSPAAGADAFAVPGTDHSAAPAAHSPYAPPRASVASEQQIHLGGEVVQAGLWKRFAASIIDSFVTGVLSYAVLIPVMLLFGLSLSGLAGNENPFASGAGVLLPLLVYPISIGIPAIYFGWMQASSSQASLGKMAVGIKVVRTDGHAIGFWRGFLRYVAYLLIGALTCGLGVLVSGLMVAFTERKQAPHDMICDTLVVDRWAYTAHPEWQRRELGTVTIVVLAIGGLLIVGMVAIMVFAVGMAASAHR